MSSDNLARTTVMVRSSISTCSPYTHAAEVTWRKIISKIRIPSNYVLLSMKPIVIRRVQLTANGSAIFPIWNSFSQKKVLKYVKMNFILATWFSFWLWQRNQPATDVCAFFTHEVYVDPIAADIFVAIARNHLYIHRQIAILQCVPTWETRKVCRSSTFANGSTISTEICNLKFSINLGVRSAAVDLRW